jgi:hypothetical protein
VGLALGVGEGVTQLQVGAGVGTGGETDTLGEGRIDLDGMGLLCATATLSPPGLTVGSGAGELALGFTPLVGKPTGASPRASNESKPPVTTT